MADRLGGLLLCERELSADGQNPWVRRFSHFSVSLRWQQVTSNIILEF